MKQILFYVIILLFSHQSRAYCQADEFKTFTQKTLDIQFKYRDADDFDDERRISTPQLKWKEVTIPELKIKLKLPPGFTAIAERYNPPRVGAFCDPSLFTHSVKIVLSGKNQKEHYRESIFIHYSEEDFLNIGYMYDFILVDSLFDKIWLKDGDPLQIKRALDNNSWASLGRQDMTEEATVLVGTKWKGLRGSNFTGTYNDNGYAGLQRFSSSFLVYAYSNNCNLICNYTDSQLDANQLGESEFYDIVSSIEFLQK
jgi:hypothetical protein